MARKAFNKIKAGLEDALAFARGEADPDAFRVHVPAEIDVRAIRKAQRLTQQEFAARYGFTIAQIRDWEQHRSSPQQAHRAFLMVILKEPAAIQRALVEA